MPINATPQALWGIIRSRRWSKTTARRCTRRGYYFNSEIHWFLWRFRNNPISKEWQLLALHGIAVQAPKPPPRKRTP